MEPREIEKMLIEETDPDELYSILIDCGKEYELTLKEKEELAPVILKYCDYPESGVRSAAIRVLCFYWGMEKYRDKAFEMYSNTEEDDGTRSDALTSWANTYRKTNNKKVMEFLYNVLKDKNNEDIIRDNSYSDIFNVSLLEPKDWPNINFDWNNLDKEVNWELVDSLLLKAV